MITYREEAYWNPNDVRRWNSIFGTPPLRSLYFRSSFPVRIRLGVFRVLILLIKGTAYGLWLCISGVVIGHILMVKIIWDWIRGKPKHIPQNPRMLCRWDDQRKTMMTLCPGSHSLGMYCPDCLPARSR